MNVLTMGSFDMLHAGHVGLFAKCRQLAGAGTVTVAVNTDEFIARFKRQPLCTFEERTAVIAACRDVDRVLANDGSAQWDLIQSVSPDHLVIGYDWHSRDYLAQIGTTEEQLTAAGIALTYVPRTGDWSTTAMRKRLTDGVG